MSDTQHTDTLSPALAGMVASLIVPAQYAAIVKMTVMSINQHCPVSAHRIDK